MPKSQKMEQRRRSDLKKLQAPSRAVTSQSAVDTLDLFSASQHPIEVVDVFCGCGGLSLGFEMANQIAPTYRLAGAMDINRWAVETYNTNLPPVAVEMDVTQLASSTSRIDSYLESLRLHHSAKKILVGGPPCQGFSSHRKKDGKPDDTRNDLVRAFAAIAMRMLPDVVVMENVPELLAKKHFSQFASFRESLEGIGYTVRAEIHNLATFGVPQERYRALVVASRQSIEMPVGILAAENFRTVRDAIGSLPIVAPGETCCTDSLHYCTRHRQSTLDVIKQIPLDGGRRPFGVGPVCLDKVDGFRDVYGRLYWDRPANTITAYARNPASGRYVHPQQNRGLTIREAGLLQSFPSDFHFAGPFDDKFIQIGNAVPPAFSNSLAVHLRTELESTGRRKCNVLHAEESFPTSDSFSSGIAGRKRGKSRTCTVILR